MSEPDFEAMATAALERWERDRDTDSAREAIARDAYRAGLGRAEAMARERAAEHMAKYDRLGQQFASHELRKREILRHNECERIADALRSEREGEL